MLKKRQVGLKIQTDPYQYMYKQTAESQRETLECRAKRKHCQPRFLYMEDVSFKMSDKLRYFHINESRRT